MYIEAGGVPFVYSSNDISFVSGMFIFAVGIQTDVTLGDIIREAQIVKYNKRQAVFKKMDQYDQLKQVEKGDIVSFTNIRFAPDSDVILEESYFILDTIAKSLIERPDLLFEIGGYTNATGFPDKEKQLSLQRAQKVVAYFYSRGVELFRMKAVGYGSLGGVLGQVNQDNRKVEIKVIEIIRKSQSR
ncbi:MAG: hypothetical protein A2355_14910 [Spirochaetes bacterium RIFOXYB1_FULL_32_8]|nr:MAG: hypothetical protein A2355_14910 [Spirochaetes bacterium RIFOXYB1_FULL_32_8]